MNIDIGARLRAVRTLYGLSQRELAKRAGVTNGATSLIEQNRVSPSVSSLKKVLDGVPMSLADFFPLDLQQHPQVFYGREDFMDSCYHAVSLRLLAPKRPDRDMSSMHERSARGAGTGEDMLSQPGEQGGVVISGQVEVTVAGPGRVWGPGEGYYF